jgi:multidrug efflux pump subunit AcrB
LALDLLWPVTFDQGQTIQQTQAVAQRADKLLTNKLGENFKSIAYYDSGTEQSASPTVVLLSFKKRAVTSPQLAKDLDKDFVGFKGAQVKVSTVGVGPPGSAFNVYIETSDRQAAYKAAQGISQFLRQKQLVRADGSKAHFKSVTISNPDNYSRNNNQPYIAVSGEFDGTDTTTLVTLAQDAVKAKFNNKQMANYGLKASNLTFNIGTQEDFQKSFNKLAFAFPLLLVAIYILLATQFRSLLQPLLIFMAIPFSLFGITSGLWLTHNPFSFFTLLGFFALLGLSLKNTILLTDYANQARRAGAGHVEAVAISLQERFRPLVATSLTAIISLIPLYFSNPFWEGLTVTLMFGLLSSTFLVITVFPYYYLGGEYLRSKISFKAFIIWLIPNVVILVAASKLGGGKAIFPTFLIFNLLVIIGKIAKRKYRH